MTTPITPASDASADAASAAPMNQLPLFSLGRQVATPGALKVLSDADVSPQSLVQRHVTGDFGQLDGEDRRTNLAAIRLGLRVLSAYEVAGERLYVITEADRSSTCVLLVGEY